jgi:hypothetical protein
LKAQNYPINISAKNPKGFRAASMISIAKRGVTLGHQRDAFQPKIALQEKSCVMCSSQHPVIGTCIRRRFAPGVRDKLWRAPVDILVATRTAQVADPEVFVNNRQERVPCQKQIGYSCERAVETPA